MNARPDDGRVPKAAHDVLWAHRDYLRGIAYRMLGTLGDVDDILQNAFLRFSKVTAATIEHPRAYLSALVTRLCIDHLRSARVRRETYVGPWLPEPLVDENMSEGPETWAEATELRDDVSLALMFALERLSPLERAAFILHDIFDVDYNEVSTTLGRDPVACRQLAARARKHVRQNRPRFSANPQDRHALLDAFAIAAVTGDVAGLQKLLAADVTFTSDGGGKVSAATKVIAGTDHVTKFVIGVVRKSYAQGQSQNSPAWVNGQPAFVVRQAGVVTEVIAVDICDGVITGIYSVRNPDKLRHLNARA